MLGIGLYLVSNIVESLETTEDALVLRSQSQHNDYCTEKLILGLVKRSLPGKLPPMPLWQVEIQKMNPTSHYSPAGKR